MDISDSEKARGTLKKVIGSTIKVVGELTGDESLKLEAENTIKLAEAKIHGIKGKEPCANEKEGDGTKSENDYADGTVSKNKAEQPIGGPPSELVLDHGSKSSEPSQSIELHQVKSETKVCPNPSMFSNKFLDHHHIDAPKPEKLPKVRISISEKTTPKEEDDKGSSPGDGKTNEQLEEEIFPVKKDGSSEKQKDEPDFKKLFSFY